MDNKLDINDVTYKEIRLLPINPRYKDIRDINFKNLLFDNYDITGVAKELVKFEGDLSDLLELTNSILTKGVQYINDQILVHKDKQGKFFYILEGNRRYLVINLINQIISLDDIIANEPSFSNININDYKSNIKKIKTLLEKHPQSIQLDTKWFRDVTTEKEEIIWQSIYSKHAGEQVGKRDWSRAKYFSDLLTMYAGTIQESTKDQVIEKLSNLFGKKRSIIANDIKSAIWIIKSIEIYNKRKPDSQIDLNSMEVSGFELVLSKRVFINNKDKTIRNILGISIDDNKMAITFRNDFTEEKQLKIIEFLVENALNKNITTREIKEDIMDDFGDLIGATMGNKTLNVIYKELRQKDINAEITEDEKSIYELLQNLRADDIDPKGFVDENYDSKFIKSIKYTIRNDLKTLSNLRLFQVNEYPFTNIAVTLRNIIDLFLIELIYRLDNDIINEAIKKNIPNCDNFIKDFLVNSDKSFEHNVNVIIGNLQSLWKKTTHAEFTDHIFSNLQKKYSVRINKLGIKIPLLKQLLLTVLKLKDTEDNLDGFRLLNSLVHKPYCGFENKDSKQLINNLNLMYNTVKELLRATNTQKHSE